MRHLLPQFTVSRLVRSFALALGLAALGTTAFAAAEVASTNAIEIASHKSVFQDDLKNGRDPFFPRSTRRGPKVTATEVAAPRAHLVLKGITGAANRRFALINNQTLSAGETATVRITNGQVQVRCLEIREDSVLVIVEGNPEQTVLKLRGGN